MAEPRLSEPRPNIPYGTGPNQVFKVLSRATIAGDEYFESILTTIRSLLGP